MSGHAIKLTRLNFNVPKWSTLRAKVRVAYRMDESACVAEGIAEAQISPDALERLVVEVRKLFVETRGRHLEASGIDVFLQQYELST